MTRSERIAQAILRAMFDIGFDPTVHELEPLHMTGNHPLQLDVARIITYWYAQDLIGFAAESYDNPQEAIAALKEQFFDIHNLETNNSDTNPEATAVMVKSEKITYELLTTEPAVVHGDIQNLTNLTFKQKGKTFVVTKCEEGFAIVGFTERSFVYVEIN